MISRFLFLAILMIAQSTVYAQKISVTDTAYEFSDSYINYVEQHGYVTVKATGTGSHHATMSLSDSVNFDLWNGATLIWSGSSVYAQIGFRPKTTGLHSAILTIAGDSNAVTVHLTGRGLYQHGVGVEGTLPDTVALGTQRCSRFTFYSPLGSPATIVSIKAIPVTGPTAIFTFDSTIKNGPWVKWDDSISFHVCVEGQTQTGLSRNIVRIVYRDSLKVVDSVQVLTSCYFIAPTLQNCIAFSPKDSNGNIDLGATTGGTTFQTFALATNSDSASFQFDSLRLAGSDATLFKVRSYPSLIAGMTVDTVHLQFTAPYPFDRTQYRSNLFVRGRLNGTSTSCSDTVLLAATVLDSTADTKLVGLPDTTNDVSVPGAIGRNMYRFIYHNGTGSRIRISNVRVKGVNIGDFALLTHYSRPGGNDTVDVGGEYIVNVGLDADNNGIYDATLSFTMTNALQDQSYNISAVVGTLSVAESAPAGASLRVTEMNGGAYAISLNDGLHVRYEIVDILGRIVARSEDATFSWNAAASEPGVYFVHASATDLTGSAIDLTRRVLTRR